MVNAKIGYQGLRQRNETEQQHEERVKEVAKPDFAEEKCDEDYGQKHMKDMVALS